MADRENTGKPVAKSVLKVSRKTFINPTAWVDLDSIIAQNKTIFSVVKNMIKPEEAGEPETFEESVQRQGLTEKDILDGQITYRTLAFVFTLIAVSSFFYGGYLLIINRSILGTILALAVSTLLIAQAFKYDFWALQMRKRKLGLTFADWKRQYLGNKDATT